MIRSLFTAGSGMMAQQLNIDTISNNLANVNTNGFKRSRVDFQDLLYQTMRAAGTQVVQGSTVPVGIQVGQGVRPVATQKVFAVGEFKPTDNPLDVAIEGDGFFQVVMPDGTAAYTRDGAFKRDGSGRIVNSDGFPLEPEIIIPAEATEISVGTDGTIMALMAGEALPQNLGQLTLARFTNPAGLSSMGRNLFRPTAASGDAVTGNPGQPGFGTVAQGYIEASNVQVVEEMVNMIVAQRAYEINSKAIQASDDMLQQANNLKR
ncbi:MAG: flagellar basal-body rod protein FlgG [Chitinophagales bacterium]